MSVSFIDGHIDEPKITDNEIIKALECCQRGYCADCLKLHNSKSVLNCMGELIKDALDLINRQKAELNQYAEEQHELMIEKDKLFDIAEKQKAEIEKLNKLCEEQNEEIKRVHELTINNIFLMEDIALIKAEAVKEFAEDVQGEIDDAIHSNYNAKEERVTKSKKLGIPIDVEDSFLMYCDGKIHALSGIHSYIDNLLKEAVGDADDK